MHFGILTIIEKTDDVEAAVGEALAPYGDGREWDWYQIGGRHTGALNGYKPEEDPRNIETCSLCAGMGVRPDMNVADGCNGCAGDHKRYGLPVGQRVKWPTQWAKYTGDIVPLDTVTQENLDSMFYGVCIHDEGWFVRESFINRPWAEGGFEEKYKRVEQELPPIEWLKKTYPDHLARSGRLSQLRRSNVSEPNKIKSQVNGEKNTQSDRASLATARPLPCPFCGSECGYFINPAMQKIVECPSRKCPLNGNLIELSAWNTRADSTAARVEKLEAALSDLRTTAKRMSNQHHAGMKIDALSWSQLYDAALAADAALVESPDTKDSA